MSSNKLETKANVSEYKSKLTCVQSTLEQAKNMPFRSKKLSLARSGVSGSSFGIQRRESKVPNSNQKAPSTGGLHSRNGTHYISAQKTEDAPKIKLFGDRRTSTNVGPSLKGLGNDNVSLRI